MNSFTKKTLVALGIAALSVAANAQFAAGQTGAALSAEVKAQLEQNKSLAEIVKAALDAKVSPAALSLELVAQGQPQTDVTIAVLTQSPSSANSVVASLIVGTSDAERAAIITAALSVKDVDVASVVTATGSGGGTGTGATGAGGGGSSFGSSAGSTFGGGGGGGASRS